MCRTTCVSASARARTPPARKLATQVQPPAILAAVRRGRWPALHLVGAPLDGSGRRAETLFFNSALILRSRRSLRLEGGSSALWRLLRDGRSGPLRDEVVFGGNEKA